MIISPFFEATNVTTDLVLVKFENKLNTHIPKCNDHVGCGKYKNGKKCKNVLHVYV